VKKLIALLLVSSSLPALSRPLSTMSATGTISIVCDSDVLLSGGNIRATLPVPPSDGCDLNIIDSDDTSGKYLIGFPASINPKLYPHQRVGLTSLAGAWIVKDRPQRYKIAPQTSNIYIDPAGDDTNDGISLPVQHFAAVKAIIQADIDFAGLTPLIRPTINRTYYDQLSLDGGFVGGYLVQLTPNGNGKFTWQNDSFCVAVRDGAWLDLRLNQTVSGGPIDLPNGSIDFHCNALNVADTGHIYSHNNSGFDLEGKPTFYGAGANDNAIFFDGPTFGAAIADGYWLVGRFASSLRMDEGGGRFTTGGSIGPAPSATPFVDHLFMVLGSNQLIQSATTPGGYSSLGPSIVGGKGQIVGNAGPAGYTATQGGQVTATKY
jgi:hypothetical protein